MSKSAQTKKKTVKKSVKLTKSVAKRVAAPVMKSTSKKVVPLHQRHFFAEHQEKLHAENPALRSLLYVMLAAAVVLIALLFMQGQNVGMW